MTGLLRNRAFRWALIFALNIPLYCFGAWPLNFHEAASIIWPAAGIALAAVLFAGRLGASAVFASALAGLLFHAVLVDHAISGAALVTSVCLALIRAGVALAAASAIRHFCRGIDILRRGGKFWRFVAIVLVTYAGGAALATGLFLLEGSISRSEVLDFLGVWWGSTASGVMLITPLTLIWLHPANRKLNGLQAFELVLLLGAFALLICFAAGLIMPPQPRHGFPRPALIVPALLWIGFRCRGIGITTALIVCAGIVIPSALSGTSLFPASAPEVAVLYLEFYLGILAVVGLGFVAVLEERDENLIKLHILNDELERKVADRTAQLERINHELTEAVSIVAHDVRGPVSGIRTLARHMRWGSLDLSLSESEELLEEIERTSAEAVEIMGSLLEIQRMNHRLVGVVPANVGKLVADACRHYEIAALEKGVSLTIHRPRRELTRLVDSDGVKLIVSNLVSNALKFLSPGGSVHVRVGQGLHGCILTVEDDGPGISESELPLVFRRFERSTNRPTAGETSSGLGLFIVRKLVLAMGGTVSAESVPGEGTIFTVEWPAEECWSEPLTAA